MTMQRSICRWVVAGVIAAATGGLAACEDLLLENPPNLLTAENLYSTVAGFEAGLNGLYALVREEQEGLEGGGNNAHRQLFWASGVDNSSGSRGAVVDMMNQLGARLSSTEPRLWLMWNWLYSTINAANTLIERAETADLNWSDARKNEIVAEARLIRAWAYRHLTYLWGDVPLHLTESSGDAIKTDWVRAPVAEVRAQMEQDLLFAEQHLALTNGERLNRAVAQHYLAELYLALGRFEDAEAKASAVVNSGAFQLITERYGVKANEPGVPFMDQFYDGNVLRSQGNTEVLWPWQYEQNVEGGGSNRMRRTWVQRYYEIPGIAITQDHGGRGVARGMATRFAVEAYCFGDSQPADCLNPDHEKSRRPDDERGGPIALRRFYIYSTSVGLPADRSLGDTLWLKAKDLAVLDPDHVGTRKWDSPEDVLFSSQAHSWPDVGYLRLAETYLVLAEALFRQGELAEAAEQINVLRRRAKASEIGPGQVTIDFILDERSRELFSEEHRRYHLVRNGKLIERTRAQNNVMGHLIQDHHVLLPIPQAVIDANLTAAMPQNPGY